ncbi:23S rRNA (adenine(2030)-N(6))-methyltransferase RlmJ [Terasakiella sp. SH-1]|uniref:23S rRNA (adenine(2030)-N(6))-methyltransferase RlmJ n=1 Tax=Terasakiella sp. SH-1 TaxID=2560057 RepID=UPI0010743C90|nr:23S rRNA (adenine(2030)-N(6))-methyltransferase RlmJ [Terasakiella sp. SH-1]
MLSYQHGYHAGNFADVHKHTALCLVLKSLGQQSRLVTYMDSHSGCGLYDLSGEQAQKTGEWKEGIGRLSDQGVTNPALADYVDLVSSFGPQCYPGSPALMQKRMADNHRALFFEFHPNEYQVLQNNMGEDSRLKLLNKNSLDELVNYLPNRKAPGLLLIDPSFEQKEEYDTIARLAVNSHKRWPGATTMVWYPILPEGRHQDLKSKLKGAKCYELIGPKKERGMYGTGLAIFNPPDDFDQTFEGAEQEMKKCLFP